MAGVRRSTTQDIAEGARLHVLTIGVSHHKNAAPDLPNLRYADSDARALADALVASQNGHYEVCSRPLLNEQATKSYILHALRNIRDGMAEGNGTDLAVIHFSGHGALVDNNKKLCLLPYDVQSWSDADIKSSALSETELREEIANIAEHGRVILFVDACHSGAVTISAARTIRALLADHNVTVFTASAAAEKATEHRDWQNGAFTKALLEALREADYDRNGLIRVSDLSRYLNERVPALTGGKQRPEVEIRFDTEVFAAAHR